MAILRGRVALRGRHHAWGPPCLGGRGRKAAQDADLAASGWLLAAPGAGGREFQARVPPCLREGRSFYGPGAPRQTGVNSSGDQGGELLKSWRIV